MALAPAKTPAQRMRMRGAAANLISRGRQMNVFAGVDQGDCIVAIVQDQPKLMDLEHTAQAKTPVYTKIHALADSVLDPRAVTQFVEILCNGKGRIHKVLCYEETVADAVWWEWKCEAQRQN
jgi:hypothetical protein